MSEILGEKKICKMCGKCCRLIFALKSYDELCAAAEGGDTLAANFLKLFLPYSSQEEVRKLDSAAVDAIIESNKRACGEDVTTYFYYCRYIGEDNRCSVYDVRPKLCRLYPKNEFVPLPTDCAYEGYSFMAREKVKAKIRKTKEQLLDIKVLRKNAKDKGTFEKLNKLESKLNQFVNEFKTFGSEDW